MPSKTLTKVIDDTKIGSSVTCCPNGSVLAKKEKLEGKKTKDISFYYHFKNITAWLNGANKMCLSQMAGITKKEITIVMSKQKASAWTGQPFS